MKLVIFLVALIIPARVSAYPQFQLGQDQTCSACHVSPAGGGLLNENGRSMIETFSTFGGNADPAHGKLDGPDWLLVGADVRAGAGLIYDRGASPNAFPMEAEAAAWAHRDGFSLYATAGVQEGDTSRPLTFFQLREHWLMWQQHADSPTGLFVRAGRFVPVYGLRFAEHNDFTRVYGQTPLDCETYGVAVEYVDPRWEAHATAFVHDPLQWSTELGNGGALYAEARPTTASALGIEGRYAKSDVDARVAGGITAKYWLAPANLLFQFEGQAIRQTFAAGGQRDQLVSYLMASWFVHPSWLIDFGLSQYDEDLHVKAVDLEAFDANLHWFASSHWELLLTNRVQTIALGSGGGTSGYALVQIHYRL
ncbi:MAG TPA: hypothetical protein VGG28_05150 [Kofleriaceae bacterium]|jgi:hypothetical protein